MTLAQARLLVVVTLPVVVTTTACRRSTWTSGGSSQGSLPSRAVPVVSGTGAMPGVAGPAEPTPPPAAGASVTLPNGTTAPLSFAPLVKASDAAVVTVFAIVRDRGRRRSMEGLGTGFLYDKAGYILTNNHVVAQATNIFVRLADERRVDATLVGRDPPTDVAVLRIDVSGLPALPLGNSDTTDVGDWVVAIGNPFGLSHTVSSGIVSAKGRTREDLEDLDKTKRGYFNFLQTDAAINQGNSGGPLLNLRGEVVGINTAIRANANNIGFAIPINMVKSILPMLVRDGKVSRSALGVIVGVLTEEDVTRLRRPNRKGALVREVQSGGPSAKAGLTADDVIVAFNGVPIADPNELRWQASIAGIGSTATVRVARGERLFDVPVTLGALPDQPSTAEEPEGPSHPSFPGFPLPQRTV